MAESNTSGSNYETPETTYTPDESTDTFTEVNSDPIVQFTEQQVQRLVIAIFNSVNVRIAERLVQEINAGDTKHAPSADAVKAAISAVAAQVQANSDTLAQIDEKVGGGTDAAKEYTDAQIDQLREAVMGMNHWDIVAITGPVPEVWNDIDINDRTIYMQRDSEDDKTWEMFVLVGENLVNIGNTAIDLENYWAKDNVEGIVSALFDNEMFVNKMTEVITDVDLSGIYVTLLKLKELLGIDGDLTAMSVEEAILNIVHSNEVEAIPITDERIDAIVAAAFAATDPDLNYEVDLTSLFFCNVYGLNLADGETKTVDFQLPNVSVGLDGITNETSIADIIEYLNRDITHSGYTASWDNASGRLIIVNKNGGQVEFTVNWDALFCDAYNISLADGENLEVTFRKPGSFGISLTVTNTTQLSEIIEGLNATIEYDGYTAINSEGKLVIVDESGNIVNDFNVEYQLPPSPSFGEIYGVDFSSAERVRVVFNCDDCGSAIYVTADTTCDDVAEQLNATLGNYEYNMYYDRNAKRLLIVNKNGENVEFTFAVDGNTLNPQ